MFAYNRPVHLEKTLASLYECQSVSLRRIYLFCDGPKGPEQKSNVDAVRTIALKYSQHSGLVAQFSQKNQGLALSIVRGINYVLQEHDSVIVVEDDIVLSNQALDYFDKMLCLYQEKRTYIFNFGLLSAALAKQLSI